MGAYVAILSYFLIELDIWNFNQYKNVTLWFICVGIYSLFQVADFNKGVKYFKETAIDLFKITTIFEFIVTFYSFNFWFEIIFIPLTTLIMLMAVLSENNKEHKIVSDVPSKLIEIIGSCIIIYISYLLISEPSDFFSEGTAYDFLVPIILTLGIFPYLYMVMLYAEYERFILRLKFTLKNDDLVRHAKFKALYCFNVHLTHLKRWDRYIVIHDIKSNDEIDASIKRIKFLINRDKKNIPVSFDKGWSHYEARRYLKQYGLMTDSYDHMYYEKWSASSEALKLGEGLFCNKITYYIDGNEDSVKCLTLVLDVENTDLFQASLDSFREIGNYLFEKAICEDKELNIMTEEAEGKEDELYQTQITELEGRQVMIQKRKYVNLDTFELRLSYSVDRESFKYADTI